MSGTDLNIPTVPQTGKNAEAIRENLKRIKLPPGFRIDLYAIVPDARHMAVAPRTNMLFVGTRNTTVWAVTDRNGDQVADEVKPFSPSLKFQVPNGVCWTKDGFLIVVEHNRILNFPAAEFFYEGPDVAVIESRAAGTVDFARRGVVQSHITEPQVDSAHRPFESFPRGTAGANTLALGQRFETSR